MICYHMKLKYVPLRKSTVKHEVAGVSPRSIHCHKQLVAFGILLHDAASKEPKRVLFGIRSTRDWGNQVRNVRVFVEYVELGCGTQEGEPRFNIREL
jgi:hypothetical protein